MGEVSSAAKRQDTSLTISTATPDLDKREWVSEQGSAANRQQLTTAQKWAREHPTRYRKKFGIAWTRYSPGWSLEFGPVWVAWHVLRQSRWGLKHRLINADRQHLHIGKRLLSVQIRRWW